MIAEEVLPEQLRGKTPQEQKFLLDQMTRALVQQKQELDTLRAGAGRRQPGISQPVDDDDDDEGKPKGKKKPLEERILSDPRGAIAEVVGELYGPQLRALQGDVEEVTESVSARDYDDWPEVKEEVYEVLRQFGAPKTKTNINQAYELVVGRRTLQQKRLAAAARQNPDIPVEGTPQAQPRELSGLEKEIFESSGMTREEWDKYGDSSKLEIKVPTGKQRGAA